MKTCKKCGETKPLSNFHKRKFNSDGLHSHCKSCVIVKMRNYRAENPDRVAGHRRKYYSTPKGRAIKMFRDTKSRAKKIGKEFNLTVEFFHHAISHGRCMATDIPFDLSQNGDTFHNPFAPSVDRRDNSKGYTLDNVQIVCGIYNMGKGEHPESVFEQVCIAVAKKVEQRRKEEFTPLRVVNGNLF